MKQISEWVISNFRMKHILTILLGVFLAGCTSQGYLLYNSSEQDVIITGSYKGGYTPLVWGYGGTNPQTFLAKSFNCDIIYNDSILSVKEYLKIAMSADIKISEEDYFKYLKANGIIDISEKEYFEMDRKDSVWMSRIDIDSVITIVVHPNGYVPIASRPHFPLRSVKRQTRCFPFWRPMEIVTPKDTLKTDGFELKCPMQLKPKNGFKVINGMVVLFEYE